jgi:hypothetical protein
MEESMAANRETLFSKLKMFALKRLPFAKRIVMD